MMFAGSLWTSFARLLLLSSLATSAIAAATITAVPPAVHAPPPTVKTAPLTRLVGADAPKRTVSLAAPSATEWNAVREKNKTLRAGAAAGAAPAVEKGKPLAIGLGRDVPLADRTIDAASLAWVPIADGGYAARVDIRSQGASALRVAITMAQTNPDVALRFVGSAPSAEVFTVPANAIAAATLRDGQYWSPVLEGGTATMEIVAPAGVDRNRIAFSVARISHLALAGASLRNPAVKDLSEIGVSGSCNVDVACVAPSAALSAAARATALIVFTDSQFSYECSGTFVNDSLATNTPYFYTASHCLESQALATTVNFYWFFDAVACNDHATIPPYVLQPGGAMLLGRSEDWDWALVRANGTPPAGVMFSGWRAEPLAFAASAIVLHHPNGDLKKVSDGRFQGNYTRLERQSTFASMFWSQGTTEPGSSGAGLFTLGPAGYELRGGLWAGDAACTNPSGSDYFSRLEVALPLVRQYLTPDNASPNGSVAAVEFYNAALDHYFMTASPLEINDLDTGRFIGWERTGFRFLVYPDAAHVPAGVNASPVCRYYLPPNVPEPGKGDSHFYSADPFECEQVPVLFPEWTFESSNVFYIQVPDRTTGECPPNTQPLWRFYHPLRTNHRYTAEIGVRDTLRNEPDWKREGYGPPQVTVIMCAAAQ
jgi:hypothetical protein